jgi:hypothetical protein
MRPWFGSPLYVSDASNVFDASGVLIDSAVRERLTRFIGGFAQFVAGSTG